MSKKKANRKKRRETQTPGPPASPLARVLLEIPHTLWTNLDHVLLVFGIFHLILFIVLLVSISGMTTLEPPPPFGADTTIPSAPTEEIEDPAFPAVGVVCFTLFTLLLWTMRGVKRRRMEPRIARFLLILLTPGTLANVYALIQWYRQR